MFTRTLLAAVVSAAALLTTTGCAVTRGQESVGNYIDDATLTTRVKAKFAENTTVSAMAIKVETLKGVVQLSGFAVSEAEKQRAAQIAASVPGVKQVQNAVVVRPPQG